MNFKLGGSLQQIHPGDLFSGNPEVQPQKQSAQEKAQHSRRRLLALGSLSTERLELLNRDGDGTGIPLALAGLLRVLEERLAEGGVAREPAVALSDGVTAGTKGGLRKHLAVVASGMLGLGGRGEGT
jgi:hypothetical protein